MSVNLTVKELKEIELQDRFHKMDRESEIKIANEKAIAEMQLQGFKIVAVEPDGSRWVDYNEALELKKELDRIKQSTVDLNELQ